MKRILLVLAGILSLSFIGCGEPEVTAPVEKVEEVVNEKEIIEKDEKLDTAIEKFNDDTTEVFTLISDTQEKILRIAIDIESQTNANMAYEKALEVLKEVNEYEWIDKLFIVANGDFTDEYGNTDKAILTTFDYSKESIRNINFDEIEFEAFKNLAENVYIK